MNILFYFPANKRTIPIDTALFGLKKRGHNIHMLTTIGYGPLHDLYKKNGIDYIINDTSGNSKIFRFIKNFFFLIKVCKRYKIDVVHTHLQQTNLVAVIAQYFIKSRVIVFRHHCKFNFLVYDPSLVVPRNEILADKIINKLASKIIVPSTAVQKVMLTREFVKPEKVCVIPYMYNFEQLQLINKTEVTEIRDRYKGALRIVMVSRHTPFKRHEVALKPIISLIGKGLDIQVLIMDDGPLSQRINKTIIEAKLEDRIHLLGFKNNILDYIDAADLIIHPSLTEASNSAIKEAGILQKIVLVCNQVGDFNDYIENKVNGLLLDPNNFASEAEQYIADIYQNRFRYKEFGKRLKLSIEEKFGIHEQIISKYEEL